MGEGRGRNSIKISEGEERERPKFHSFDATRRVFPPIPPSLSPKNHHTTHLPKIKENSQRFLHLPLDPPTLQQPRPRNSHQPENSVRNRDSLLLASGEDSFGLVDGVGDGWDDGANFGGGGGFGAGEGLGTLLK